MKSFAELLCALFFLAGCAGTPIAEFTHADFQNAQKIASTPERAAVWKAADAFISAQENVNSAVAAQAKACAESLKIKKPDGTVGIATMIEAGTNAVDQIDTNCKPIKLPFIN